MKALLLGGSGFIGTKFIMEFQKKGDEIVIFDKTKPVFKEENEYQEKMQFIGGDFNEETDFLSLTKDIDIVFHFISTTNVGSQKSVNEEIKENIIPTVNLLEACVTNSVKRFVFLSSGGTVYGRGNGVPFSEHHPLYPISSYGVQKVTIEKYIHLFWELYGLDYRIIRISNPYGVGQSPNKGQGVIAAFSYAAVEKMPIKIFGDGMSIRDYIHIDDVVEAIYKIAAYDGDIKVINLGSGHGVSVNDIVDVISKQIDYSIEVIHLPERKVDVPYSVLNTSLYQSVFGGNSFIPIEKGINEMINFYLHLSMEEKQFIRNVKKM